MRPAREACSLRAWPRPSIQRKRTCPTSAVPVSRGSSLASPRSPSALPRSSAARCSRMSNPTPPWRLPRPQSRPLERQPPRGTTRPARPSFRNASSSALTGPDQTGVHRDQRSRIDMAPRSIRPRPTDRARGPLMWEPFPSNQTAGTRAGDSLRRLPLSDGIGRAAARAPSFSLPNPEGDQGDQVPDFGQGPPLF